MNIEKMLLYFKSFLASIGRIYELRKRMLLIPLFLNTSIVVQATLEIAHMSCNTRSYIFSTSNVELATRFKFKNVCPDHQYILSIEYILGPPFNTTISLSTGFSQLSSSPFR